MPEQRMPSIDYYILLMSDWAYLGHVKFSQISPPHRVFVNDLPFVCRTSMLKAMASLWKSVFGIARPIASRS